MLKNCTRPRPIYIRVICKVRKTQHQNPEFGHRRDEIKKTRPAKKYIHIQLGGG
jgi:hypothetical protein